MREETTGLRRRAPAPPGSLHLRPHRVQASDAGHPTRRCAREWEHSGPDGSRTSRSARCCAGAGCWATSTSQPLPAGRHSATHRLVRGLMDTDGWWSKSRRRAGFTTTDDGLAADVLELLRSLGMHPQHFVKPYQNAVRPDRNWHIIEFTRAAFNPFSLPRKAMAAERGAHRTEVTARGSPGDRIRRAGCPPCPRSASRSMLPTRSILAGRGFVPTHNTGSSPGADYEAKALFQMKFYALVIWRMRGVVPQAAPAGLPRQRRDPPLRARRGRPAGHRAQGQRLVGGDPAG